MRLYNDLQSKDYQYWIHNCGYSDNTVKSYTYDLNRLLRFLNDKISIYEADLNKFVDQCVSPKSRNRTIAFLKNFYGFQTRQGFGSPSVPDPIKVSKDLVKYDRESIKIRLRSMPEKTPLQTRDKLIAYLLFYSRYKVSELCAMQMIDSVRSKNIETTELIVKHNYTREDIWRLSNSRYRFTSRKAENINRRSIWRIIKKIGIGPQVLKNSNEDLESP